MADSAVLQQLEKKLQEKKSASGRTLYGHLAELFAYLLQSGSSKEVNLEELSCFVKANSFLHREPLSESQIRALPPRTTHLSAWLKDCSALVRKSAAVPKPLNPLPDLVGENDMYKWAGLELGEEEVYRVQKSLCRLLVATEAKSMRFWGRFYGVEKDYYVAEGMLAGSGAEDIDRPKNFEPRGTGVNALTYWVTDNVLEDWIELPDITPEQLQVARKIKKLLRGDLNAEIKSYPLFPGKERHLLRAQIARITHGTVLIPKGIYKMSEDDVPVLEFEEEQPVLTSDEMGKLESWAHLHPHILTSNRITHADPEKQLNEEGEEIDIEELKAKQLEEDPLVDRLRAIAEDEGKTYSGFPPAKAEGEPEPVWLARLSGDAQPYAQPPPKEATTSYAVNVLYSLRWPGAYVLHQVGTT